MLRARSWNLYFRFRLVCPIYDIWKVLRVSLYIALVLWSWVLLDLWFRELLCCVSALEWDIYVGMLEEIGNFFFGLWYVKIVHFLLLFPFLSWYWRIVLCCICTFRFFMSFSGKLLFCAIDCISFHSVCCLSFVSGNGCVLETWFRYAAILCNMGWMVRKLMAVSVVVSFRNISI